MPPAGEAKLPPPLLPLSLIHISCSASEMQSCPAGRRRSVRGNGYWSKRRRPRISTVRSPNAIGAKALHVDKCARMQDLIRIGWAVSVGR